MENDKIVYQTHVFFIFIFIQVIRFRSYYSKDFQMHIHEHRICNIYMYINK